MDRKALARKQKYEEEMKRKRQRIISPEIGISPETKRLNNLKNVVLKQGSERRIVIRREN